MVSRDGDQHPSKSWICYWKKYIQACPISRVVWDSFQIVGSVLKLIESYKLYASRVPKTIAKFSDLLEEIIGLASQ